MVHKLSHKTIFLLIAVIAVISVHSLGAFSTLARNDAFPLFGAYDRRAYSMVHLKEKLEYKDPEFAQIRHDLVHIGITPFGQNADRGRNLDGQKEFAGVKISLGDLPAGCHTPSGRWSMIALLFGPLPGGKELPPSLVTALNAIFPGLAPGTVDDPKAIDPLQQFGYFTFPLEYRKRGLRFDLSANIIGGFGINFQTGVVCMTQTVTEAVDLTCPRTADCDFPFATTANRDLVECNLMQQLKPITQEIGLDICDFSEVSVEEVRFSLFWRHAYELNGNKPDWPHVLFIPFFTFGGSVSPGKRMDPNKAFAVPFGNNDHSAVSFTTGLNFDFLETVEIGAEVGVTHFFDQDFDCFRVPNHACQSSIYPFTTDVTVSPGLNWHFSAKLAAFHFLEHLSTWFEYMIVEHKPDTIQLKKCDPAFLPEQLEKISGWRTKLINIGFNYDVTPNLGLGFTWQLPLDQHNTYRSTTVLFSFYATF